MRKFRVTVNGLSYEVEVEEVGVDSAPAPKAAKGPTAASTPPVPPAPKAAVKPSPAGEGYRVTAPLPGAVLDLKVSSGEEVREGQVLVILEAMKMENEIIAPKSGRVTEVLVSRGSSVNLGDVLLVIA